MLSDSLVILLLIIDFNISLIIAIINSVLYPSMYAKALHLNANCPNFKNFRF